MAEENDAPAWARQAAEEIKRLVWDCNRACQNCSLCTDMDMRYCEGAYKSEEIAAIIVRHCGEEIQAAGEKIALLELQLENALANVRGLEKVLETAAKWMEESTGECPVASYDFCPRPDGGCENTIAACWIEYWKKSACVSPANHNAGCASQKSDPLNTKEAEG